MRKIGVGLLGCGTVGGGLVRLLAQERDRIRSKFAVEFEITRILVRDLERARQGVPPGLLTTSPVEVIDGPCEIVVELLGGTHTAATLIRRALHRGRHVVTANKALLSERGAELQRAALAAGVSLGIEASVCGGVPVLQTLRRGLAGDTVLAIRGILNGTCNYVLTRLGEGLSLADAVLSAQRRGLAEADPSLDLSGEDALQKLKLLSRFAFDEPIRSIDREGIEHLTPADLRRAAAAGGVLRQVAEARRVTGGIALSVGPRFVESSDVFAAVRDEQNAIAIETRAAGELLLRGRGAGSLPTASAVLSDLIAVAQQPRSFLAA